MNLYSLFFLLLFSSTFCQQDQVKINGSGAYMIIDPKVMSQDIIEAFDFLSEQKKIIEVTLKNNETLENIKGVRALKGGYLMVFTLKSLKGDQYKIVPLTDIFTIKSL